MIPWLATWIWQGVAITLLVTVALRLLPWSSAASRYLLWCITLAGVLSLAWTALPDSPSSIAAPPATDGAPLDTLLLQLPAPPLGVVVGLVTGWLILTSLRLIRIGRAILHLRTAKSQCQAFPGEREQHMIGWRAVRETGRRARLMVSDDLPGVAVLGLTRPQIVFARDLLDGFRDDDLDRMALHEYAHVQRRDDWMYLGQSLVTTVLNFHPAIRWINDRLTLEREVACDDWVVAKTGFARQYASCLARVAEWQASRRTLASAPAFFRSPNHLPARVDRLLARDRNGATRPSAILLVVGVALVTVARLELSRLPPLIAEAESYSVVHSALPLPHPAEFERLGSVGLSRLEEAPDAVWAERPNVVQGSVVTIRAEDSALRAGPPLLIPLAVDGTAATIGTAAEATDSMASLPSHPYVHSQLRGAQELPSAQRDRSEQRRATEIIRGDATNHWKAVAGMGKVIGVAAARAGRVTADAVTRASTSIARATMFNSPKKDP